MKNHYLITQIADILMQMYENGDKGIRELKYTIKKISEEFTETEDLEFAKMQTRKST